MGDLSLLSRLALQLLALCLYPVDDHLAESQRPDEDTPDQHEDFLVGEADVLGQLPAEVLHWDERLVPLQLVPLVAVDAQSQLLVGDRADVPGDVVAPAGGLYPVDTATADPDEVPGLLGEAVDGDALFEEIVHIRPV